MLTHYGEKDYAVAASEAAAHAKNKLYGLIDEGRSSAQWLVNKVQTEVPEDRVIAARDFRFDGMVDDRPPGFPHGLLFQFAEKDRTGIMGTSVEKDFTLEDHALSQICGRTDGKKTGLAWKYAQWLREPDRIGWGLPLLANNLNEIYKHQGNKRYLVRSYHENVRGFLSDSYRRLDSRPLLEAFATTAQECGAVPIRGYGNNTKVAMKALLPYVFEPADNEVIAFGAMWENSDYGKGKLKIWGFMMRLWCTNYMISETGFSQVHLGKKLSDNMLFSQKTYDLDTATSASAIKDVVTQALSPDTTNKYCEVIRKAHEQKIDPRVAIKRVSTALNKGETELLTEIYNTGGVELLPPGDTAWRLSNALSWVAGQSEDQERKLDIMKVAGGVLSAVA